MKTLIRDLGRDLVEKRLWPVAAALVIALVAVPMFLSRGGDAPAPQAAAGAAPAQAQQGASAAKVSLAQDASATADRTGSVRNPFKATGSAAKTTATTTTAATPTPVVSPGSNPGSSATGSSSTPAAATSTGSTGTSVVKPITSSPVSGSTSGSTSTGSTPAATTTPSTGATQDTATTHKITLRFGPSTGGRKTMRDVARLTALPNAKSPVTSLLGVMRDGKTVAFGLAANVVATGNGTCKPSPTDCKTVEMRAGDAQYFRIAGTDGAADRWYYLKLIHVERDKVSAQVAEAARVRRSRAGMAVVRESRASYRAYRYLPALGVLVRAKRAAGSASSAQAGTAGKASVRQPGVAVFRSVKPAGR